MATERKLEDVYPRAPRYTIEIGDDEIVRYALSPRGSKAMHTRILNLSESGMAFLAPYLTAPEQGEKIKVEFTAPSTDPIACFANVTRVELHKTYHLSREPQTFKLVAVEFDGMHPTQRNRLSKGLRAQMQKKLSQYKRRQVWNKLVWTVMDLSKKLFGNKKSSNLEKTDLS